MSVHDPDQSPQCFGVYVVREWGKDSDVCLQCPFYEPCGVEAEINVRALQEELGVTELVRQYKSRRPRGRPRKLLKDDPQRLHSDAKSQLDSASLTPWAERACMIFYTGLVEDRDQLSALLSQAASFRDWLSGRPASRGRPIDPVLNAATWLCWRAATVYLTTLKGLAHQALRDAGPSETVQAWQMISGEVVSEKTMTRRLARVRKLYSEFKLIRNS